MTEAQKAAYINAEAVSALIEAMGMHAENQQRAQRGEAMAYSDKAFFEIINKYGIHSNAVVAFFHDAP